MRLGMLIIAIVALVAIYALAARGFIAVTQNERSVPACEEDELLVGMGPFDDGRWESYACGPAVDDYTP